MNKLAYGILWVTGICFALIVLLAVGWLIYNTIINLSWYSGLAVLILVLGGASMWAVNYLTKKGKM